MHSFIITVSIVTEVAAKLAKQDVYTTLYNIDMYNKEELKSVLTNLNTDLVGGALNISLICDNDSILTILKMVSKKVLNMKEKSV